MAIGAIAFLLFAFIQNDLFGSNENFVSADPLPKPVNPQSFHQQKQQGLTDAEDDDDDDEVLVRVRKSPDADPRRTTTYRSRHRYTIYRSSGGSSDAELSTGTIVGVVFGTFGFCALVFAASYCYYTYYSD